ncbi:MAG: protoporphyrinogen oxidase [Acidimicrobiales bacterium]
MSHIVVVGAGMAGLAAGWEIRRHQPDATLTVHEAADRPGGKIHTSSVAGIAVDEAADAFLARVPAAVNLCRELGLETELVAPARGNAQIWLDGRLQPLPHPQILGVPLDPDALAASGIVSDAAVAALRSDLGRDVDPVRATDTLGSLIRRRLGDEIFERLVAPLIGSIAAGDVDRLGLEAVPQIASAARAHASLVRGLELGRAKAGASPDDPVFYAPRRGMGSLVDTIADRLGSRLRLRSRVGSITPEGDRIAVETAEGTEYADAVVLATEAAPAADLVEPWAAAAAAELRAIETTSVAFITLVYEPREVPISLDGSGFLVPAGSPHTITACSWTSSKWDHIGGGHVVLRASVGRAGDDEIASADDARLIRVARNDLAIIMRIAAEPDDVRVSRWPNSFPQYAPGHAERVIRIEEALSRERVFTAGASYRGIGVPACIDQGRTAARMAVTAANAPGRTGR